MGLCEWQVSDINEKKVKSNAEVWGIPFLSVAILYSRGLRTKKEVFKFLNCEALSKEFFKFTDMDETVKCLKEAIKKKERICVYGDYDADGITATTLVYCYLKDKGADVTYYIPNRDLEGYGLNIAAVEKLYSQGVKVLLTVDNGVSAHEEVKKASLLGMKVIITDHHKVPESLPSPGFVIDPWRENWEEEYKNLAGVGVAYKLLEALEDFKPISSKYMELVAIGSLGDSMPLFGETRYLVKKGLEFAGNSSILGVRTLIKSLGINSNIINSIDATFKLVPRINASGRMETADLAVRLLISENEEECISICNRLDELNSLRKEVEKEILEDAEKQIRDNPKIKYENVIILKGENWHHGVLGIAASKISQRYGKPCILISFSYETGEARGSCRSVEGFSIYNLVVLGAKHLERFGGHTMAAGINLKTENIEKFCKEIIENSKKFSAPFPKLRIDLKLNISSFSNRILDALEFLEPYGNKNPEPIFLIERLKIYKIKPIGNKKHLKLTFYDGIEYLNAFYFNKTLEDFLYKEGDTVDIAVTAHKNEYKNIKNVSVYILDLKLSGSDIKKAINQKQIYEKFKRGERLSKKEVAFLLPTRIEFARMYRYFISRAELRLRVDTLSHRLFKNENNYGKIYIVLDVLQEMNLINVLWYADEFKVLIKDFNGKVDLSNSAILNSLSRFKGEDSYG